MLKNRNASQILFLESNFKRTSCRIRYTCCINDPINISHCAQHAVDTLFWAVEFYGKIPMEIKHHWCGGRLQLTRLISNEHIRYPVNGFKLYGILLILLGATVYLSNWKSQPPFFVALKRYYFVQKQNKICNWGSLWGISFSVCIFTIENPLNCLTTHKQGSIYC